MPKQKNKTGFWNLLKTMRLRLRSWHVARLLLYLMSSLLLNWLLLCSVLSCSRPRHTQTNLNQINNNQLTSKLLELSRPFPTLKEEPVELKISSIESLKETNVYTSSEAAKILNIKVEEVRTLSRTLNIGKKVSGRYIFTQEELEKLKVLLQK